MSRPVSWYPLAPSDPVPGDPVAVRRAAAEYASVALAISTAADRLREIAELGANRSDAVAAVTAKADEVAGKITRAHGRYEAVGQALDAYAGSLDAAQADSLDALAKAQNAEHALGSAQSRVAGASRAVDDAPPDATPDDVTRLQRDLAGARADRDAADRVLARAREDLQHAVDLRDGAARRAIEKIRAKTESDDLDDGWWDNWGSKVVHVIADVAGTIAAVAGILALVLCWVPVLGQALAAVAAIATAVKLIADLVLVAEGEGSWGDVGWDAFALATFGAGRVLSTAARAMSQGAKGIARLQAGRFAAQSVASRAAQGLPTGSSASTLRSLLSEPLAALTKNQARALARSGSARAALTSESTMAALSPQAIWSDAKNIVPFLRPSTFRAAWSSALGQAASNFSAGTGSASATIAASQGESALTASLGDLGKLSPALLSASGATGAAVTTATVATGTFGGVTAVAGYDQAIGFKPTGSWLHGEPAMPAIVSSYEWIFGGPTPADRLHLPGVGS